MSSIPSDVRRIVAEALSSDSNDSEHDALVAVADEFNIAWVPIDDNDEEDRYTIVPNESCDGYVILDGGAPREDDDGFRDYYAAREEADRLNATD
jgi:hypothetical protein